MNQVTEEGRNALRGLRVPAGESLSLETALSRIREEFAFDQVAAYRVVVHGDALPLNPIIRDEAYRIGREAVVNAFLHAQANNIEVKVEYVHRYFRILVSDDGRGMDPHVLETGREGHWGLPGMRERSENMVTIPSASFDKERLVSAFRASSLPRCPRVLPVSLPGFSCTAPRP